MVCGSGGVVPGRLMGQVKVTVLMRSPSFLVKLGIGDERGVWDGEAAERPTDLTRHRCRTTKERCDINKNPENCHLNAVCGPDNFTDNNQ